MQTIDVENETLRFRIPASWEEVGEDDTVRVFHDRHPDGGTLRVYLLTLTAPEEAAIVNARTVALMLERLDTSHAQVAEILPSSHALVTHQHFDEEDGQPLEVRFWLLGRAAPPRHIRVAVFAYTLGTGDDATAIQLLDTEIRAAQLSDAPIE